MGIPVIGCECDVCSSEIEYNKRLRTSALLKFNGQSILIDTTPDLRLQALEFNIERVDGVICTHMHYDHIAGIDDIRVFNYRTQRAIPYLIHQKSYTSFEKKYDYLLQPNREGITQKAQLELKIPQADRGELEFLGGAFRYFTYQQGGVDVMGFRFGSLAYVTDIKDYPETIFEDLQGTTTLVVSALRETESTVHFNIEEAIAFARRVGAERTYLIHMAHEIEHERVSAYLPEGVELAFDGMKIKF